MADEKDIDNLVEKMAEATGAADAWTQSVNKAQQANQEAAEKLKAAARGYAQGLGSLSGAMLSNQQSMSKYGAGLQQLSSATGTLLKSFGPLGAVLSLVTKAFELVIGSVLKQNDALVGLNQEFSKTGQNLGVSSQRMLDMAHAAGFSVSTLQGFSRAVGRLQSTTLTLGTTAAKGAENFAQMNKITDDTRSKFLRLGYTNDEIIETFGEYARLQGSFGLSQGKTVDQLREGATKYTRTLSELTALTGESRDELQKRNQQAAADLKFQIMLRTEGRARADEFIKASTLAGSAGAGVRDFISGLGAAGEEGRKLMLSTGGAIVQLTEQLKREQIDAETFNKRIAEAQAKTIEQQGRNFIYSREAADQFGVTATRLQEIDRIRAGDPEAARRATADAQLAGDAQRDLNAQRIITEKNTQQTADKMVNIIAGPVSTGLTRLAELANIAATSIGEMVDSVRKLFGAETSSERTATRGGRIVAPTGVVPSTAVGTGPAATGQTNFKGPDQVGLEDYIKFTSGTGSIEHFSKLQPHVGEAFVKMARDYNQLFQKQLQVNSAFRSPQEQATVDSGTNPRAAPGMSLHQEGRAIDIQSEQVQELVRSELLERYGFKTLAGDPPHIYMRNGGIADGPESGYRATLHGKEAVVPLPDGRSIPVKLSNTDLFSDLSSSIKTFIDRQQAPAGLADSRVFSEYNQQLNTMLNDTMKTQETATATMSNKFDALISKIEGIAAARPSESAGDAGGTDTMMLEKFDQMIAKLDDLNSTQNEVLTLARASG